MSFRIGIDSYSYRACSAAPDPVRASPWDALPNGGVAVLKEIRRSGAEYASLETMFMDSPTEATTAEFVAAVAREWFTVRTATLNLRIR